MAGEKILVVEDEGIVARETEYRLKDLGYAVCGIAASGAEAIRKAEKTLPDVVLMDIMLKGEMDGVDAAEQIHSTLNIPVVYVTAHADENTVQRAKATEPMGYLLKPFNERELHAAIEIAIYKHRTESILKDREELLATTLKSIGDAVIVTDTTGAVTFMNPAAELLTPWKLKDASGKPVTEVFTVVSETTHALAQHPAMRALSESVIATLRNHVLTSRGGREIGVDGTATPIMDDAGRLHGAVLVFRDVAGHRKADESLRLTQHAIDLLPEAIVRYGPDGRILYANDAVSRMLGYAGDDLTWMSMQDIDLTLKGSRWDLQMERLKTKVTLAYETTLQRKNGDSIPVEVRAHYFVHDNGQFIVALLRDIAQEKVLIDSRLKEGAYARGLIDSASVMIIGLDREGAIHSFNKEVEAATGYAKSALEGKNLFEVILPISKNVSIWRSFLDWQASRLQLPVTFEAALVAKTGAKRLISWCINETRDEQAATGLVLVGIDVTDQKQMELALSHRNEELHSLRRVSEITMKPVTSPDEVFQAVSAEVASAVDYPFVAIEQYDEERQRMILRGVKSLIPVPPNMEVPLSETLSGVAMRTGHLLVERTVAKRPEYASGFLKKLGISTYICAPIMIHQKVFGALTLGHTEVADVSDQLQHYVVAVANHLASFLNWRESPDRTRGKEEPLLQFFAAWPEAFFECSDGKITTTNTAALTLFKAESAEQIVHKPLLDLVFEEDRRLLEPYLQKDTEDSAALPFVEVRMQALDGTLLSTEVAVKITGPIEKRNAVVLVRDNTRRKDAEREARAAAEKLQKLMDEREETESRFQRAFEMSAIPLLLLDETLLILKLNSACERFLDIEKQGAENKKNLTDFVVPEEAEAVRAEITQAEKGSAAAFGEHHITGSGGLLKNVQMVALPIRDRDGPIVALIERAQTARQEVVHEHDSRPDFFREIGTAAFVAGTDTIISASNEEFEKLSACSREELEGVKSWHEFIIKEDLPAVEEYVRMLSQDVERAARRHDLRMKSKDGATKEMRLTVTKIPGTDKIVFCLVDMRERKWAEQAWLASEKKYRHTVDTLMEGIWVLDPDGTTTFVTDRMARMLKYEPDEMMGKRFFLFVDVKNAEKADQRWEQCRHGVKDEYDAEFIGKDGKPVYARVSTGPMFDDAGAFRGAMLAVADISDKKAADERVKTSSQERELYLREIHHRVKNNLQVVSSLLYLQSKNVREPGTLEILLESLERVRSIALIHEQLYKSTDLTHVNFTEYLNSLTANLFHTYAIHNGKVELKLEIDEGISLTPDKAIPCGLIVNELVSNALRHAFVDRSQGTILVRLHKTDDKRVSLTIADDGIGLPPHVDFRNTPSLGLQLIHTLVNQLGATIELTLKKGTAFTVTFA